MKKYRYEAPECDSQDNFIIQSLICDSFTGSSNEDFTESQFDF